MEYELALFMLNHVGRQDGVRRRSRVSSLVFFLCFFFALFISSTVARLRNDLRSTETWAKNLCGSRHSNADKHTSQSLYNDLPPSFVLSLVQIDDGSITRSKKCTIRVRCL